MISTHTSTTMQTFTLFVSTTERTSVCICHFVFPLNSSNWGRGLAFYRLAPCLRETEESHEHNDSARFSKDLRWYLPRDTPISLIKQIFQLCFQNNFEKLLASYVAYKWCRTQCFSFQRIESQSRELGMLCWMFSLGFVIERFTTPPGRQGCWNKLKIITWYFRNINIRIWVGNFCFRYPNYIKMKIKFCQKVTLKIL